MPRDAPITKATGFLFEGIQKALFCCFSFFIIEKLEGDFIMFKTVAAELCLQALIGSVIDGQADLDGLGWERRC
jgi:hypothetical protein